MVIAAVNNEFQLVKLVFRSNFDSIVAADDFHRTAVVKMVAFNAGRNNLIVFAFDFDVFFEQFHSC